MSVVTTKAGERLLAGVTPCTACPTGVAYEIDEAWDEAFSWENTIAAIEAEARAVVLLEAARRDARLREALDDAALWLEAEADHPRPDPHPAMRLQAGIIRAALAEPAP